MADAASTGGILSEVLTAYRKLSLAVQHLEGAVLTPTQGASLIAAAEQVSGAIGAFLDAHGQLTPARAALIVEANAGFTAAVTHLENQTLTSAEGQGLISQSLRIGDALAAHVIPQTPVAPVLKGYRDFTLAVEHAENAVLSPTQGGVLISSVTAAGARITDFLIAHNLYTPAAAQLINGAVSGATAALDHLEGQVLTPVEGQGLISQSLRVGAGIADFLEHPHPLSVSLFNQYVAGTAPGGSVAPVAIDTHPAGATVTLAAAHAA